jgi:hypothetical protein
MKMRIICEILQILSKLDASKLLSVAAGKLLYFSHLGVLWLFALLVICRCAVSGVRS